MTAAELIEALIEKNNEWWRNESHCKGEMRELGVPDDADAPQTTMADLRAIEKALNSSAAPAVALKTWRDTPWCDQDTEAPPAPTMEELKLWREAWWDGPFQEAKNRMCDALLAQSAKGTKVPE